MTWKYLQGPGSTYHDLEVLTMTCTYKDLEVLTRTYSAVSCVKEFFFYKEFFLKL